jgi:tRNA nucleotidyltransferase/poly(A) polymerase
MAVDRPVRGAQGDRPTVRERAGKKAPYQIDNFADNCISRVRGGASQVVVRQTVGDWRSLRDVANIDIMTLSSPSRDFALEVVRTLRDAGFEALWAGGCVRDQLLGLTPKDYDVATSARPEEIRKLFGRRRTVPVGAAFGVITVLGPKEAGQIEVATFRSDGAYLDGRHPESVTFGTAELDAQRRDFTINGLFFDPLQDEVIDYVGGREDLQRGLVRAIGSPRARLEEDKLRMLRAVRFAATFGFAIEPATLAAVQQMAGEIVIVSAERIAAEMRRVLAHPRRALAVRLLRESRLLPVILPEAAALDPQEPINEPEEARLRWETMLAMLDRAPPRFPVALALVLRPLVHGLKSAEAGSPDDIAAAICRRWKLANDEIDVVVHLFKHEAAIRAAASLPWPQLQRLLVGPHVEELLAYCSAVSRVLDGNEEAIQFSREKLALPPEELDPPPLLTGEDLKRLGMKPGPQFRRLLDALRDAQLDKLVRTREEALAYVQQLHT